MNQNFGWNKHKIMKENYLINIMKTYNKNTVAQGIQMEINFLAGKIFGLWNDLI